MSVSIREDFSEPSVTIVKRGGKFLDEVRCLARILSFEGPFIASPPIRSALGPAEVRREWNPDVSH